MNNIHENILSLKKLEHLLLVGTNPKLTNLAVLGQLESLRKLEVSYKNKPQLKKDVEMLQKHRPDLTIKNAGYIRLL